MNTHAACSQGGSDLYRVSTLLSKADTQLSKAEMDLSKADVSFGGFKAAWIDSAEITIVLLGAPVVYGLWLIILALREEYVYKKFIKKQNNA